MRTCSVVRRCFAALPLIGIVTAMASGCAVDATGDASNDENGAVPPSKVVIKPLTDAERFPAPQPDMGDGTKACSNRADWVDDTWLDWGPFPQGGNYGWPSCGHFCPAGSYAYSIQLLSEGGLGSGGDDTALNGIAMDCYHKFPDINGNAIYTGTITSQLGWWGGWGTRAVCPVLGTPIVAGTVTNLEGPQGSGDDTALNAITAMCSNGTVLTPSAATHFGGPVAQDSPCQAGTAVCGIETQLEPKQGSGDDTALNGAVFLCCTF